MKSVFRLLCNYTLYIILWDYSDCSVTSQEDMEVLNIGYSCMLSVLLYNECQ